MEKISVSEKLHKLRLLMKEANIDYYYIPSTDQHFNEYLPACWKRREWISDFTGSAGDVLVGLDFAYLWTDPRYFLQARDELNPDFYQLMAYSQGAAAPIDVWLKENAQGKRVGVDPKVMSINQANKWRRALTSVSSELVGIEDNFIDKIWADQPPLNTHPIKILDTQFSGIDVQEKLITLRQVLGKMGADAQVVTMLDAIAWLFNIRGNDIQFNPLSISYAIVNQMKATICINSNHFSKEQLDYFQSANIEIKPYAAVTEELKKLRGKVLIDPNNVSWWFEQHLTQTDTLHQPSPISLMKAIKNPTEVTGMHEAHRLDAIAMVKFLHWLENNWQTQTEISAATQLADFRKEDPNCQGLSFETISGYGPHGAIIHYRVSEETNVPIKDDNLYLVDSGGQYWQGTTDITRTIHLGKPTQQQKHHYTLVLKGHLALRHTLFPKGSFGEHLNAIAHHPLWQEGMDFGHGTGHGVGCFLCVHEGPQRISGALTGVSLLSNMVVSNEPGLYFENQYGIRIENLCVITEKIKPEHSPTGHGPFLGFEDLTVVPYARNLINTEELSQQEMDSINQYHQHIYKLLKDHLQNEVREWLKVATQPL